MKTIAEYIQVRRQTIAMYVAARPIFTACVGGERRRGSMPRQWWWEQPMCLDAIDATGSNASNGNLLAPNTADAEGRRNARSQLILTIPVSQLQLLSLDDRTR